MPDKIIRVTTDVGGTFTDLVHFETDTRTGRQTVRTEKSDTTPPDFEKGVLAVLAKGGVDIGAVDFFAHGTTVVINALTERKGAKVGLITTKGFRDVPEIGRGNRPDFFNLMYRKPEPFVERYLRREVVGRVDFKGGEQMPLDLSELPGIVADFQADGVNAVAICLIHAYANPAHEEAVLAELRRLWPGVTAIASHQITREWREYERTSTTVLSAYVQPTAERYLERLEAGLKAEGYRGSLYIMQSNCGVDAVGSIKQTPITMVESGPASGFWGAAELGRIIGEQDVLALDIGGTTTKCSLIKGGHVNIKTDYWIERHGKSAGYPIMAPVVDLVEIGNGGGSIAWVDDFQKLHVGPKSAGAIPGPASYGRGGRNATTTDANLALGRINKDYFCGGSLVADMDALDSSLTDLADKLGMTNAEVARGKELGVKKVVVPRGAPVFSAWGMLMSDLRRDYFVTELMDADNAEALTSLLDRTKSRALADFARENVPADKVSMTPFIRARYQNQEFAVEVKLPGERPDAATMQKLIADFHDTYEREYTYRLDAGVEIIGLHLIAASEVGKLEIVALPMTGATIEEAIKGRREVDYATEGVHEAVIFDGTKLEPGMSLTGPAVIEDPGTTVVVHPGNRLTIDDFGNIHIDIRG